MPKDRNCLVNKNSSELDLHCFMISPGFKTPGLSLFEAEVYSSAVVVQQLIGNLIYHSNRGEFEPRLASRWHSPDPRTWRFTLRAGLTCENGEAITAESFRASLLRSIRQQEKIGGALIFRNLEGFRAYIEDGRDLPGIEASGNEIIFKFSSPVREGVLQTLSYAPYGYISSENFKPGSDIWKDDSKFISSGPYKVVSIDIGRQIVLEKRDDWRLPSVEDSPKRIFVEYELTAPGCGPKNTIVAVILKKPEGLDPGLIKYPLVPEYVGAIVLGNFETGFFAELANRQAFEALMKAHPMPEPTDLDLWTLTDSLYPNEGIELQAPAREANFTKQKVPLKIQGRAPQKPEKGTPATRNLAKALDAAKLSYEFVTAEQLHAYFTDKSFDIRIFVQSVGAEIEPWPLNLLFCSPLSFGYPDPTKNISRLLADFNEGKIDKREVTERVFKQINEDKLIFPMIRVGVTLYLSSAIDQGQISPKLSVPRFDQMRIIR